jgi:uncharacterized membrane protein
MADEPTIIDIKEQILRSLREFYPIKVDEIVLISAIQKNNKDESIDQISKNIQSLLKKGWVEESLVEAPFGKAKTYRFQITPSGIEHLQSIDYGSPREPPTPLSEIESRIYETYDRIRGEMAILKQDQESNKEYLQESNEEIRKSVLDLSKELSALKEMVEKSIGRAETERVREEQIILRILSGDEKTIYFTILDAGGEMFQKELVARTRMSNAKVSRMLDQLDSRGILTKQRHGATNRLRLTIKPQ